MADKIALRVNGVLYPIKLNNNALADFELEMGRALEGRAAGNAATRALLWAGIRAAMDEQRLDTAPSIRAVGAAITEIGMKEATKIVEAAMLRDYPDEARQVGLTGEGDSSL